MPFSDYRLEPGSGARLGATWDGAGTNFALFSAHAEKVELCLFNETGRREIARIPLPEYTHQVWHGYLPDVRPGAFYGYRVHGPYAPEAGHRFNPNKLLLDPYARAHAGELRWHDSLFGYKVGSRKADLSFDRRDSAFVMPKCVVTPDASSWGEDVRPQTHWSKTVIYEAHVAGMTLGADHIDEPRRGTFEGLAQPGTIEHLKRLGVTAIELLPIHAFPDDRHLLDRGLVNWWGYNTMGFFAPATRYLVSHAALDEFRVMVRRLHDAGIEVILDVVYNHTAEGNQMGPTLSFRGIDNASYYLLGDDKRYYYDTTGTGNTLDVDNRRVLQMVMDSLRYWVENCHVDGFRFDLASTLGRRRDTFDPHAPFFDAVLQDPVLSRVKMIAEPWDTGNDGYQMGNFPPGWAEWNDTYRDTVRAFWKGDEGMAPAVADRLMASASTFEHRGRRPWASINFITAHDGFTLADLVAYNDKHNEANGEDNNDGHDHNVSWNHGVEGPTDDPDILALRDRQRRNLMATLLLSQGTPMILMGDEHGRSQGGNNNTYCQPGEMNWLDWSRLDDPFVAFVADLIALRNSRPLLTSERFLHAEAHNPEGRFATWRRRDGSAMDAGNWEDPDRRLMALLLQGDADRALFLAFNAGEEEASYALPPGRWHRLVDTETTDVTPNRPADVEGEITLRSRSLILLEADTPGPVRSEKSAGGDE
ncbi:glycogen debranching protein GlgX [Jannaschia rubra]|uniref:Glycogen debranching enzyme n=1 Tax=Jannaschia rubra TaxID=282197 RepID=A0A0M6XSA3_9RHOB|nr:glycogen debranching protein GlgX [Jannaschia rubra]CTQ33055.1 Glycogen debranching enzyme [Jannaschia rubra]SFG75076.1 glycogen operon protein [Jannaschia rubra]